MRILPWHGAIDGEDDHGDDNEDAEGIARMMVVMTMAVMMMITLPRSMEQPRCWMTPIQLVADQTTGEASHDLSVENFEAVEADTESHFQEGTTKFMHM